MTDGSTLTTKTYAVRRHSSADGGFIKTITLQVESENVSGLIFLLQIIKMFASDLLSTVPKSYVFQLKKTFMPAFLSNGIFEFNFVFKNSYVAVVLTTEK